MSEVAQRRDFQWGLLIAVCLLAWALLLSLRPRSEVSSLPPEPPRPWAVLPADSAIWSEQASLLDVRPLFIPTRHNYRGKGIEPLKGRDERFLFGSYEAGTGLVQLKASFEGEISAPEPSLTEGLKLPVANDFRHFGQRDRPARQWPERDATYRLLPVREGQGARMGEIAKGSLAVSPPENWPRVEMYCFLQGGGGWQSPVIMASSGSPEFDQALRAWLEAGPLREGLPAGYYRVEFGP